MKSKLLHDGEERTWALVFDMGDEVVEGLTSFAEEQDLSAAHFYAIGALESAVIQYWNWDTKEYEDNPVREQVEVVGFTGNVSEKPEGGKNLHVHVVLGRRDGSALGGHLKEGHVRPTLEVVVTEEPSYLRRKQDETTKLALIDV